MQEIYMDIIGYKGLYKISNLGNVQSLAKADGRAGRILSQEVIKRNHTNYRRVTLSKDGKVKRFQVHRLVAHAFIPNPENKPQVNHIDNNGENNVYTNLEWCTGSENMIHSLKQGRLDTAITAKVTASVAQMALLTKERHEQLIGKQFANLVIEEIFLSETTEYSYNAKSICLLCECSCIKALTEVVNGRKSALQCNDCTQRMKTEANKQKKLNNLIGTSKGTTIVTKAWINPVNQRYYVEVTCNNCNSVKIVTLEHFKDKRYTTNCCVH
jgi:hypothetical protein